MLLINIHHYIMGLAGSAQEGGEEPGRRRLHAGGVGGRIPGPGRRLGAGGQIPKWGPEKEEGSEWEELEGAEGSGWRNR